MEPLAATFCLKRVVWGRKLVDAFGAAVAERLDVLSAVWASAPVAGDLLRRRVRVFERPLVIDESRTWLWRGFLGEYWL